MLVASPWLGGSGMVARRLAIEFLKLGHSVHLVTFNDESLDQLSKGIQVHIVKVYEYGLFPFPLYEMSLVEKIIEVAVDYKIDVINSHYGVLFGHATALAMNYFDVYTEFKKPKFVLTFHGTDVVGKDFSRPGIDIPRMLQKTILRKADKITVVSQNLKELLLNLYDNEVNIDVIENGIECTNDFEFGSANTPIPTRKKQFIHVSNFRKVKNTSTVIEAFKLFADTYSDYMLALVGDGPELEEVKRLVQKYELNSKVNFYGICNEEKTLVLLKDSDAIIMPSLYESFPLAILEAFSVGIPTIASKVGGIQELVKDGTHGILVPEPTDAAAFCDAMMKIVSNQELYLQMTKDCLLQANKFSIENSVKKYLDVYRSE